MGERIRKLFFNDAQKGQYDYLAKRRRQQLTFAVVCFVLMAAIVGAGLLIYRKRANILMIPGLLMALPFANFLVTYIAIANGKPVSPEKREILKPYEEGGMLIYHLHEVDEKGKRHYLDCVLVYQGGAVAYGSLLKEEEKKACEDDVTVRLKKKGLPMRLKIYPDWEAFRTRIAEVEPFVPEDEAAKVEKTEEALLGLCL